MANLTEVKFKIIKATDLSIVEQVKKSVAEAQITLRSGAFNYSMGGSPINFGDSIPDNSEELNFVFSQQSELFQSLRFDLNAGKYSFHCQINRNQEHQTDTVHLKLTSVGEEEKTKILKFTACLRKNLQAVDAQSTLLNSLDEPTKMHFQEKENTLNKLESISQSIVVDQEKYRQSLDKQYQNRLDDLEKSYQGRSAELDKKKDDLEKRLSKIDDRESRHARRSLRDGLKKIFKDRGDKFVLSSGTIALRKPIHYFTVTMLVLFGTLFTLSALATFNLFGLQASDSWVFNLKQIALAIAFGSTAIFYIRWNNSWFERHSSEEFILKRQEIDIDRASWAVELASEWMDEKGKEIPEVLLDKITKGIFEYEDRPQAVLHPAEELASAIFGASSNVKLKLPNGNGEVEFDRKSQRLLQKERPLLDQ